MKHVAVVIALGFTSGVVGVVVASRFIEQPTVPPHRSATTDAVTVPAPVVPPGWDQRLVGRVTNLEQQVYKLNAAGSTLSNPQPESYLDADAQRRVAQREQERLEDYRNELLYRDETLTEHAQEPTDNAWAQSQEQRIHRSLSDSPIGATIKNVDCRSKTCTAILSFSTPSDALVSLQKGVTNFGTEYCHGFTAIPAPPTSNGPYDLTIVYNCR